MKKVLILLISENSKVLFSKVLIRIAVPHHLPLPTVDWKNNFDVSQMDDADLTPVSPGRYKLLLYPPVESLQIIPTCAPKLVLISNTHN